jgi:hypothetical protein
LLKGLNLVLDAREKARLLTRLELNPRIVENPYHFLPVADDGHSAYVQAGRLPPTGGKSRCGAFRGRLRCKNKEVHEGVVYKGVDYTGKNVVMNSYYHCFNAVCVVCFVSGFSVRTALKVECRILEAVGRGFGVPEHIVFSPPLVLREKSFDVLFKLARGVARDRGVSDGGWLPHGRRIDRKLRRLVWSPHLHCIGFVDGGFERCRNCVHVVGDCKVCNGFKGRQVRGFAKDGWIVKIEPPRQTIYGTVYYIAHHVTVKLGVKRFCAVRWFGRLGNSVFKALNHPRGCGCPVCKVKGHYGQLEHSAYWGKQRLSPSGCNAVPDFDDDGSPNFPDSEGD